MRAADSRTVPIAWRAMRLVGFVAVIAGLFAMHGLDTHGSSGTHPPDHLGDVAVARSASQMPLAATASDMGRQHSAQAPHSEVAATGATVVARLSSVPFTGYGMGMATLCMAVLVLTALAMFLLRHRRLARVVVATDARSWFTPLVRGRDPDPPCHVRLSIQRC